MTDYPRTIDLESPKLFELLQRKGDLIVSGREKSEEIEKVEIEMKAIDEQIQVFEKSVDTHEFDAEAKALTESMNAIVQQMDELKAKVRERLLKAISPDAIALYEQKKKEKEVKEGERNKIALKVQQYNDKIIPLTQKLMKPFLKEEGDDYDSIRLEDGKIVGTIFNHFDTFRQNYNKRAIKS